MIAEVLDTAVLAVLNTVTDMPEDYIPKHSIFHHDYRAGFSRHKRKISIGDTTALLGKSMKESVVAQTEKAYEEEIN